MSEHTPEPWVLRTQDDGYDLVEAIAYEFGPDDLALLSLARSCGVRLANKRRRIANACAGINPAAVPDLLAAGKLARQAMDHYELSAALTQLGAAIAKAERTGPDHA